MSGREKYILIALNKLGIDEIDHGGLSSDNVEMSQITEEEFESFYESGVLEDINDHFDTILDYYEEDWIGQDLSQLLEMVKPVMETCPVVYSSIKKARDLNTGVFLNF